MLGAVKSAPISIAFQQQSPIWKSQCHSYDFGPLSRYLLVGTLAGKERLLDTNLGNILVYAALVSLYSKTGSRRSSMLQWRAFAIALTVVTEASLMFRWRCSYIWIERSDTPDSYAKSCWVFLSLFLASASLV